MLTILSALAKLKNPVLKAAIEIVWYSVKNSPDLSSKPPHMFPVIGSSALKSEEVLMETNKPHCDKRLVNTQAVWSNHRFDLAPF